MAFLISCERRLDLVRFSIECEDGGSGSGGMIVAINCFRRLV